MALITGCSDVDAGAAAATDTVDVRSWRNLINAWHDVHTTRSRPAIRVIDGINYHHGSTTILRSALTARVNMHWSIQQLTWKLSHWHPSAISLCGIRNGMTEKHGVGKARIPNRVQRLAVAASHIIRPASHSRSAKMQPIATVAVWSVCLCAISLTKTISVWLVY